MTVSSPQLAEPAIPPSSDNPPDTPDGAGAPPSHKIYVVGTLRYTFGGLVVLFAWLMWGDFCFSLFENIFGKFMPLYLKQLHASNTVISLLSGGIAGGINFLFLPGISMATDRYRGRWGRRIPFLLWSTPCTVLALVLIAYAPDLGRWMLHVTPGAPGLRFLALATLILILVGVFTVSWHFFNMVLVNLFRFLMRDVIPQEVMGRFMAGFQMVGVAANVLFSWFVFPYVLSDRKLVCVGLGLVYLAAFIPMCWRVKEGDYPPPEPHAPGGILQTYMRTMYTYFRECLSVPIYRNFVIFYAVLIFGSAAGPFQLLFFRKTLGLSMIDLGHWGMWPTLAGGLMLPLAGWLCDRINAVRIVLASLVILAANAVLSYFFMQGKESWFIFMLAMVIPGAVWSLGLSTVMMELFPAEKFGQFFSSINVLGFGSIFISSFLVGLFMDYVHSNYRMVYVVSFVCNVVALVPMYLVYRDWKRHGGPHNYVPPLPRKNISE